MQPSTINKQSLDPLPAPSLDNPPDIIPINAGRQLFVDDYLIEETTLTRIYHAAKVHEASPVLLPETELEMNHGHCPLAAPFNDGLWYDPADGLFKLWYHAGWFDGTALATSTDGLNWTRPKLDVIPGTNAIIDPPAGYRRDGGLVWLDHSAPLEERYKMFLYFRWADGASGFVYTSPDGIHWGVPTPTSKCGDNSSFFYNPFRQKYVFSIREGWGFRARAYHEHEDFRTAAQWVEGDQLPWARVDEYDVADPLVGDAPQLYDVTAVAYESIMLGTFAIFYGPQNPVCAQTGDPKLIDIHLGYSRDGFHFHRPQERLPFIPCSRNPGSWNYGYTHTAGGVCLIVGDELWFYYGTFSGNSPKLERGETGAFEQDNSMYAGGSMGLATLRRDGFASMDAGDEEGTLLTLPLTFDGCYLFVNIDNPKGKLTVEAVDQNGEVLQPFTAANCLPIQTDSTKCQVGWKDGYDLSELAGCPVRLRFRLQNGKLYSFWVSPSEKGESRGYVAAGGPGFTGAVDK